MTDWWLIARAGTATAVHAWHLGYVADQERAAAVVAARVLLDFPPGDSWATDVEMLPSPLPDPPRGRETVPAWDLMLTVGEQHNDLMQFATIHDPAELERVPVADLATYMGRHQEALRGEHIRQIAAMLAELDGDTMAAVMAEHARLRETQ